MTQTIEAECYFCARAVDDEDYCYGCKEYVCETCDVAGCIGPHEAQDHKKEE